MSNRVLDPPGVEDRSGSAVQSPAGTPFEGDTGVRSRREGTDLIADSIAGSGAEERSISGAASPAKPKQAETTAWSLGAHLTIGAIALFLLAMLAIVAVLSVPSASLLTLDGAIALGIIVLSLVLSGLLMVANRKQRA